MGLVLHQARGALAARHAGPHTVGRQLPEGHVLVEAGAGTGRATLIEHEATVQGTAHHCRQSGRQGHSAPVILVTPCSPPCTYPIQTRALCTTPPTSHTGHHWLTTERGSPPGRRRPSLATVAGIGFQGITEAGVSQGARATGTEVINTGSKEGLWWHYSVAATERGGLQHPTPGIGLAPGTITCCSARIHLTALGAGPARSRPLRDLGGENGPGVTTSLSSYTSSAVLQSIFHPIFCFSFKNLPTRIAKKA